MTNKQQTQVQQPIDEWELNAENLRRWLLSPFEKSRQPILDARERMKEEGISDKMIEESTRYEPGVTERSIKEFLKLCTNSKTGELWDIETLQNAGKLSEGEVESILAKHNGRRVPYYYIYQIQRVLDDRVNPPKEYLTCNFLVEALCVGKREGVVNPEPDMRINESGHMGYYYMAHLTWDSIVDRYDKNNTDEKRIAVFNDRTFNEGNGGTKTYDIPWNIETFHKMMEHTNGGKVGLSIIQLSTQKNYGISSIEEFCTDDLPGLVKRLGEPPAAKDLANFVAEFKKQNLQQDNKPQAEFLKDFLKEFVAEFRRQSIAEVDENTEHYK